MQLQPSNQEGMVQGLEHSKHNIIMRGRSNSGDNTNNNANNVKTVRTTRTSASAALSSFSPYLY
jgi:hypothetical protein